MLANGAMAASMRSVLVAVLCLAIFSAAGAAVTSGPVLYVVATTDASSLRMPGILRVSPRSGVRKLLGVPADDTVSPAFVNNGGIAIQDATQVARNTDAKNGVNQQSISNTASGGIVSKGGGGDDSNTGNNVVDAQDARQLIKELFGR